jgi:hypothetical protein
VCRCVQLGASPQAGCADDRRPRQRVPSVGHAHQSTGGCCQLGGSDQHKWCSHRLSANRGGRWPGFKMRRALSHAMVPTVAFHAISSHTRPAVVALCCFNRAACSALLSYALPYSARAAVPCRCTAWRATTRRCAPFSHKDRIRRCVCAFVCGLVVVVVVVGRPSLAARDIHDQALFGAVLLHV